MTKQYSHTRRLEAAMAVFDMDKYWAEIFPEGELKDLCYCDLFTQLWVSKDTPIPKSELYKLMPNISPRTAVKYVQLSIELGMLEEKCCESDKRIRLISPSQLCIERVEKFLDYTCDRFRASKA
jgi:hypothetical protein